MNKIIQSIIQIIFLMLFFILILIGRIQLWMGLFVIGIITAAWFGRIYCGWICPINTVMSIITWLKRKLHIKSFTAPAFLSNTWTRNTALAVFFAAFLMSFVSGARLPVLPVLFTLGIIATLFYPPDLWHRHLCPFGTILSFPAKLSRRSMRTNPEKCNHCGLCEQICPSKSVKRLDDSYRIIKNECLVCMKCSRNCRKNAITYQSYRF